MPRFQPGNFEQNRPVLKSSSLWQAMRAVLQRNWRWHGC